MTVQKNRTDNRLSSKLKQRKVMGTVLQYPGHSNSVWAIGSGKGGVGKSFITVNLSVMLAQRGHKVLMIDADFGAANLHTLVGNVGPSTPLASYLSGTIDDFSKIIAKTTVPNLDIISGVNDPLDVADLHTSRIERLGEGLKTVDHDYILIDVGPGTAFTQLDLLLLGDETIIVSTPEATSVENTYRLMKSLFLRKMRRIMNNQQSGELKKRLGQIFKPNSNLPINRFGDIFHALAQVDTEQEEYLRAAMEHSGISILINNTENSEEEQLGVQVQRGCRDYFNLEIGYIGFIPNDSSVKESIRARTPLTIYSNASKAVRVIDSNLQRLLQNARRNVMSL